MATCCEVLHYQRHSQKQEDGLSIGSSPWLKRNWTLQETGGENKRETETQTSRDWMVDVVSGASVRLGDIPGTSRKVAASFDR